MWMSLLFLPFTPATAAARVRRSSASWTCSSPIRRASSSRLPGGWGIMADDLMAGVYANLLLRVAARGPWARAREGRDPGRRQRAPDAAALGDQRALPHRPAARGRASRWARASRWPTTPALLESAFRTALGRARHRDRHRRPRAHRGRPHARGGGGRARPARCTATPRILEALTRALRPLRPRDGARQREAGRRDRGRGRAAQPRAAPRPARRSRRTAACSSSCPGRPHEMQPMFEEQVLPDIRARAGGARAAHAHPAHRVHVRERRRAGGGADLQDASRTRAPRSSAARARSSCT